MTKRRSDKETKRQRDEETNIYQKIIYVKVRRQTGNSLFLSLDEQRKKRKKKGGRALRKSPVGFFSEGAGL